MQSGGRETVGNSEGLGPGHTGGQAGKWPRGTAACGPCKEDLEDQAHSRVTVKVRRGPLGPVVWVVTVPLS